MTLILLFPLLLLTFGLCLCFGPPEPAERTGKAGTAHRHPTPSRRLDARPDARSALDLTAWN